MISVSPRLRWKMSTWTLNMAAHNPALPAQPLTPILGWQQSLVDFKFLLLEQLLEIRVTWYWHVMFALIMPMALVFGFGRIGSGLKDTASLLYIISGAAIFSVANDGLHVMATRIGVMRK